MDSFPYHRRKIFIFFVVIFCVNLSYSQNSIISFSSGASSSITNLNWSIAGNEYGQSPNILSELKYKNIISIGGFIMTSISPLKRLHINTFYSQEKTVGGKGRDSDYGKDNCQDVVYNEPFNSNKGSSHLLEIGAAYNMITLKRMEIDVGLSYYTKGQHFYILNSDLQGLKSTYNTKMNGGQISLRNNIHVANNFDLQVLVGYGRLKYNSTANWNLIEVFAHPVSFKDGANGESMQSRISCEYHWNNKLSIFFATMFAHYNVFKGKDISYLKDGSSVLTQFNGANMNSGGFNLGVQYSL